MGPIWGAAVVDNSRINLNTASPDEYETGPLEEGLGALE
jgi:hypothetical protein